MSKETIIEDLNYIKQQLLEQNNIYFDLIHNNEEDCIERFNKNARIINKITSFLE